MTAPETRNDAEVPLRRHRRREPWCDRATGEPVSDPERAASIRCWPAVELVAALAGAGAFRRLVPQVRDGSKSVVDAARWFARSGGRPLRVVAYVIEQAAESAFSDPQLAVYSVMPTIGAATGSRPAETWQEDTPHGPITNERREAGRLRAEHKTQGGQQRQWTHSSMRRAAVMVALLGSGSCIRCGATLAGDGSRRRYCAAHEPKGRFGQRAERPDREAIRRFLNAAGDALGID